MLPPLVKLRFTGGIGAPESTVDPSTDDRSRIVDLPRELQARIVAYLAFKSLESLKTVVNWCSTYSTACDERLYKTVVETCIGPTVQASVPLIPNYGYLNRIRANPMLFEEGQFFRWLMKTCVKELTYMPTAAADSFLQSNQLQRHRWESLFFYGALVALRTRCLLDGNPIQTGIVDIGDLRLQVYNLQVFEPVSDTLDDDLLPFIERGWKMDVLPLELIRAVARHANYAANSAIEDPAPIKAGKTRYYRAMLRRLQAVTTLIDTLYKPRLERVMRWGALPIAQTSDLMQVFPDFKTLTREEHYQIKIFEMVLNDMRIHKFRLGFVVRGSTLYNTIQSLLTAFFEIKATVEAWMDDLKLIRFNRPFNDERHELEDEAFGSHFFKYKTDVREAVVQFLLYMATPAASSESQWTKKYTITIMEEIGFISRDAKLLEQRLIEAGFERHTIEKDRN